MSDDTGKQSYRDLLISGLETLHDDINGLRRDIADDIKGLRSELADEKKARSEYERSTAERLAKLETKIAVYAGVGALLGGTLVEFASRQLHL